MKLMNPDTDKLKKQIYKRLVMVSPLFIVAVLVSGYAGSRHDLTIARLGLLIGLIYLMIAFWPILIRRRP